MPKLGICKCCSGKVSNEAPTCPHCGQPDPYIEVEPTVTDSTVATAPDPQTREDLTHKFFICHASEDKGFVERLNVHLSHEGVNTWFDGVEIKAGDNLVDRIIREGIPVCSHAGIVLSKKSVGKQGWVKKEVDTIVSLNIDDQIKIVPILIEDVDIPLEFKLFRYVSFVRWPDSDDVFTNGLRDLVGSLIPRQDDLARFRNPKAFKAYWKDHELTGNEAKLEAYQILSILGGRFGDFYSRTDAIIYLVSRKLRKRSQDREDFLDFVLSYDEMQSRWPLHLEKANHLKGVGKYDDAERKYKEIWCASNKKYWRAAVELFKLYADQKTEECNRLSISLLDDLESTDVHSIEIVEILCRTAYILEDLNQHDSAIRRASQVEDLIRNIDDKLRALPQNRRASKRRIVTTTTKDQLVRFYRAVSKFDKAEEIDYLDI